MVPIRIALVDCSAVLRRTVRSLLDSQPDLKVIAEAEHGADAVIMAREHHPDVVLMSFSTKFVDAVTACEMIRTHHPKTKVILWSVNDCEGLEGRALKAGASSILCKGTDLRVLVNELRAVHRSGSRIGIF
jgi:DNA-binding NarL/FixJ family response regulator